MALPSRRRREMDLALVHVRAEDLDAERARLVDVLAQLGGVRHVVRHHRAEKFDGIIGLQVGGLIRDDGVGGGVGFVETVAGEFFQQIENLVRLGRGNVVLLMRSL